MAKGFENFHVGSWIDISTNARGMLSDFKWSPGFKTFRGQIVGFDTSGYPVLYFPDAPANCGTWSIEDEKRKKEIGVDSNYLKTVPTGKDCIFVVFEPSAIKAANPTENKTPMKHNLKIGQRVVVAAEKHNASLSTYGMSDTAIIISATVVGQKADGNPILYCDSTNSSCMFAWDYNYGSDQHMIDASFRGTLNVHEKRFSMMSDNTSFINEQDYKNGVRIPVKGMPYDTFCIKNAIGTNYDAKIVDTKDFIRAVTNCLPADDAESHLFGEQFTSLLLQEPARKHDVFVKTKQGSAKIANNLRNVFTDASVIYSGLVDNVNADLITEEYLVKWRNTDMTKQYKVHVSYPKDASVISPFDKGGVDANSFQMFRKDYFVKNFANADFDAAVKSTLAKSFTAFGVAAQSVVDDLNKKGFVSKEKTKEKKKMSTKNDSREDGQKAEQSFLDMMVSDFNEAKFRVAADQTTHLIKEGMVKLLNAKGGDSAQAEIFKMMLDSDGGEAAIAWLAGIGLTYGPGVSNHPQAKRFAKEFRVNGQAKAGNLIAETVMGGLIPILANALSQLPSEEQLRVAEPAARVAESVHEEEEELVETKEEAKKAVA